MPAVFNAYIIKLHCKYQMLKSRRGNNAYGLAGSTDTQILNSLRT